MGRQARWHGKALAIGEVAAGVALLVVIAFLLHSSLGPAARASVIEQNLAPELQPWREAPRPRGGSPDDYTEMLPDGMVRSLARREAIFEVIAAHLTTATGTDIPVLVEGKLGGFAGSTARESMFRGGSVVAGDFDVRTLDPGTCFALIGRASRDDWSVSYASDADRRQVITLRNGDALPAGVELARGLFEAELVDEATGTAAIGNHQVLVLFELGTTDPAYADYDDLAILVTLAPIAPPAER
ncbi:hypothetical protein ACFL09_03060 [Planctomycetota bacterium]